MKETIKHLEERIAYWEDFSKKCTNRATAIAYEITATELETALIVLKTELLKEKR